MQRIRVKFSKDGPMRFTSHLDLAQTWERLLRRANVPVAYSQGFNPQPRLNLAAALPLGFTSQCELVDILLEVDPEEPVKLDQLQGKMSAAAPLGLTIRQITPVADLKEKALQAQLEAIEYRVRVEPTADLDQRIQELLAANTLERERRGKIYDLRPLLKDLYLGESPGEVWMLLATQPGGRTGRPDEVLSALNLDPLAAQVHRTRLILRPQ
jgi:radical SAM-linked protein